MCHRLCPARIHVCEKSGLIAVANLKKQQFYSPIHRNEANVVQVGSSMGEVNSLSTPE